MDKKPHVAALIPMRHYSERIPGKNFRPFSGTPLFHHIIQTLAACPEIDTIAIDTDSPTILEQAAAVFPQVRLLERPPHLRDGAIAMNDVLLHSIRSVKADLYLQTHATNPLLRSETVSRAINTFWHHQPVIDSLFSVTRLQTRLWNAQTQPVNHDPSLLQRTQDLPPLFEENSCIYLFSADSLQTHHSRIGARPRMFEIDAMEAVDIDVENDFLLAELLHQRQYSGAIKP